MSTIPERLVLPSDLKESILAGRCVAYIGSGASDGCYLPWHKLVTGLCKHCSSDAPRGTSFDDLCVAAEGAKARDVDKYRGFLRCHFGRPVQLTNFIYSALLQCKFRSYMTTNFDPLLAHHARLPGIPQCNGSVMWYPNDLPIGEIGNRTIYYLHGYIGEDTEARNIDVVLSESEFRNAYQPDGFLKRFLIETFRREDVCFIGCGLRGDDPIKRVFEVCQQEHAQSAAAVRQRGGAPKRPPKRFILRRRPTMRRGDGMVDSERTRLDIEEEEAYFRDLDIKVIWYEDHSALPRAFSNLAGLPEVRLSGLGNGGER